MDVRVGTSGFSMDPPEYVGLFGVVELQDTLRRLPRLADARRLRAQAPEPFEFTIRAPAAITRPGPRRARRGSEVGAFRDEPGVRRVWKTVLELAQALDCRVILFQTPSTFSPSEDNVASLTRFFEWAHRGRLRLGWEPHCPSWTDQLIRQLTDRDVG